MNRILILLRESPSRYSKSASVSCVDLSYSFEFHLYQQSLPQYGCSRGVYGAPFFFVNGFLLPDAGSALDFATWKNIIDPLLAKQKKQGSERLLSFLMQIR